MASMSDCKCRRATLRGRKMSSGSSFFSALFGATGFALRILSRNFDESATSIAASVTRGRKEGSVLK
jgi:hypothetical protein